jgi:hypothetical protein
MYEFMGKDGVVLNIPVWHKSRLERRDYLKENILQSVGKDFGDDGPEVMDKVRASFLGYKSNEGMIKFLKQMMILEEVSNTS